MLLTLNYFYPRSPCGERRKSGGSTIYDLDISIHALLAESDRRRVDYLYAACKFLSTLSLRRATDFISPANLTYEISIHALLAESDAARVRHERRGRISIHALLAESDRQVLVLGQTPKHFYPRSPCGERHLHYDGDADRDVFLSTLSLRRATASSGTLPRGLRLFLSTLSLRRATDIPEQQRRAGRISIHALLAESDPPALAQSRWLLLFLSTLSLRRATPPMPLPVQLSMYFYPRSPCGERLNPARLNPSAIPFLSTLSLRRATCLRLAPIPAQGNFYPRSPCGERRAVAIVTTAEGERFLSTLSLRRATLRPLYLAHVRQHFYPRSPCGERQRSPAQETPGAAISIHALLAESDGSAAAAAIYQPDFYPRSPCGERPRCRIAAWGAAAFLSTLSLRRATHPTVPGLEAGGYFYPRSPCGERQNCYIFHWRLCLFLSTLSLRRATFDTDGNPIPPPISIHALLAESDEARCGYRNPTLSSNFYPRSPCGERLHRAVNIQRPAAFLSTLSLRRATRPQPPKARVLINFYPRSPCGERRQKARPKLPANRFLSTLSLRRATRLCTILYSCPGRFLSTLSLRRATSRAKTISTKICHFYPRSPCGERLHTS